MLTQGGTVRFRAIVRFTSNRPLTMSDWALLRASMPTDLRWKFDSARPGTHSGAVLLLMRARDRADAEKRLLSAAREALSAAGLPGEVRIDWNVSAGGWRWFLRRGRGGWRST